MTTREASLATFRDIHDRFNAAISRYDCGKWCAPLLNGEPVCCSTRQAIPIVQRNEYKLLRQRTDMWHELKPYDATSRNIVKGLHEGCKAVECRGAAHCERQHRTLACRAFPFFPYFPRQGDFIGLATYWIFEDRCWMISHLEVVERDFVTEFCAAYQTLFDDDPDERDAMREHSAAMRRVFTRWKREIPLIGRDGGYLSVAPGTAAVRQAKVAEFKRQGPFVSLEAYREMVEICGGIVPAEAEAEGALSEKMSSPKTPRIAPAKARAS
jgi:hypothetical protein